MKIGKSRTTMGNRRIRRLLIMERGLAGKIFLVAFIACLLGFEHSVQAQDKPLKKISWGVTSLSASNWIPWIAKEAKIYEKHGLDVELVLVKGSGQTSTAILGGSLFAAPVAVPQVMLALLAGADLVNIAHTVPGVQSNCWSGKRSNGPKISKEKKSRPRPWAR
jgi:ABC-type nitrate/sulfonate/bicarbonate transport system substrate-binding protein